MSIPIPAAIISFGLIAAILFTAIWMGVPRLFRHRAKRRQECQRARLEGSHEACSLTGDEAAEFQDIARENRHLGKGVAR